MSESGKNKASIALLDIYNNVRGIVKNLNTIYAVEVENNKILKEIYYRGNPSNTVRPVGFTIKNMTDAQLRDLVAQGLSYEYIYYLSNKKFSIEHIRQIAKNK